MVRISSPTTVPILGARDGRAAGGEHLSALRFGCAHGHQRHNRHVQDPDRGTQDHQDHEKVADVFDQSNEAGHDADHEQPDE